MTLVIPRLIHIQSGKLRQMNFRLKMVNIWLLLKSLNKLIRYVEICDYDKKHKSFTRWDYYNDSICTYKKKDIKYWMKIPDYK